MRSTDLFRIIPVECNRNGNIEGTLMIFAGHLPIIAAAFLRFILQGFRYGYQPCLLFISVVLSFYFIYASLPLWLPFLALFVPFKPVKGKEKVKNTAIRPYLSHNKVIGGE